ncbi:helix-turn-helix transcriptional regulator [Sphingobium aromaticivastans]|uniref:helix-turn-helix transcriptional regulator n=1 Tax=Sphingobium aromaticivastans TaxID=1778665 RepID=UPI00301A1599
MTLRLPDSEATAVAAAEVCKILDGAAALGIDGGALLHRAGAPYSPADIRGGRIDTVPRAMYAAIYREYVLELEIEASRKSGRPPITQEDYGLLWCSVMSCRTLGAAIDRAAAFSRMLEGRMGAIEVIVADDLATFRLESLRLEETPGAVVTEAIGLAMFDRMFSWLIGEPLGVAEIQLKYAAHLAEHLTPGLVPKAVRFGCARSGFAFPAILLDKPVVRSPDELEALLPLTMLSISPQADAGPLARRVLHLFDEAIIRREPLPVVDDLAQTLRCSPASLRRRLHEEGASVRQLKDRCRLHWALEMLRQPGLAIADIAARLSFSDETAFRRAFRQWTGQRPSAFRNSQAAMSSF